MASKCRCGSSTMRWQSRTPPSRWTSGAIEARTIGPIELRGVRSYASRRVFDRYVGRDGYAVAKVTLVVRARRSLALSVRGADPRPVLLAYGEGKPGATLLV